jgi:hypothetical protein
MHPQFLPVLLDAAHASRATAFRAGPRPFVYQIMGCAELRALRFIA